VPLEYPWWSMRSWRALGLPSTCPSIYAEYHDACDPFGAMRPFETAALPTHRSSLDCHIARLPADAPLRTEVSRPTRPPPLLDNALSLLPMLNDALSSFPDCTARWNRFPVRASATVSAHPYAARLAGGHRHRGAGERASSGAAGASVGARVRPDRCATRGAACRHVALAASAHGGVEAGGELRC
jgi:hypothetical protein